MPRVYSPGRGELEAVLLIRAPGSCHTEAAAGEMASGGGGGGSTLPQSCPAALGHAVVPGDGANPAENKCGKSIFSVSPLP